MGKGFYISRTLAVVGILLAASAIAVIVALAVVYAREMDRSGGEPLPSEGSSAAPTVNHSTAAPSNPWNRYRLPDALVPSHYEVFLWPRLERDSEKDYFFTGNSTAYFDCVRSTDLILIHSHELSYTASGGFHAELRALDSASAPGIRRSWLETQTQFLVIELDDLLKADRRYSLHTVFEGKLADDLTGFYRSQYIDENGNVSIIATTQMQPTDARKAFPCFDEPAMKANFSITLVHKPKHKALSNMPAIRTNIITQDGVDWNVTDFKTTPKMSSYLLAFIVSDFISIDEELNGTSFSIWARRQAINEGQGNYALEVTGKILKFFESYYNVAYPLPKSDQIALPDFNAGAMENWGLVTYRETALLYDPKLSSNGNKERVVKVIAHELAHQWFGNLVTIKWWNDLWLNEGFASYVEYLGADHAEQTWHLKDLIVLSDVYKVFAIDALASSHPLSSKESEINSPSEINELFDSISYSKGASVLRMLSSFLSEEVFLKGLNSYLTEFSFSNTVYNDLFQHLQKAVESSSVSLPASVTDIMSRWTLQMGFPVVKINSQTGEISQNHFLLDPNSTVTRPSEFGYVWIVPITYMKQGGSDVNELWLNKKTETSQEMKVTGNQWILANINVTGYYRVNYDENNWKNLLSQLEKDHKVIPIINRAQIIADSFNLARADYRKTTDALNTTKYLTAEIEYIPWQAAFDNLYYITLMLDRSEVYGDMKNYMRQQTTPLYNHFKVKTENWTVPSEGHQEQYNEVNALSAACTYGLEECQTIAVNYYKQWMNNSSNNSIPLNLKTTVYCNAIALGGEEEWEFAWKMFKSATIATEEAKLRSAMACSKEPWILQRYLDYTLDSEKIRKQDATSTIGYIANNVVGQPLAWNFVRAKWNFIFEQYGGGSFSFSSLIDGVTKRFSSEFELQQLEQFKKDNEDIGFGSGTRALEQALEKTKANIQWVSKNKEQVHQWFIDATVKP
uniref:Aminopeptidase n=1 Tax=Callorhinchus milii TaxID=7868 RepID=A0A4W3JRQ8_CALMI|eukprot:gi/632938165/ref/XP_007904007.1/ PREDICTED: aminopeptidase N [Callorhinchus milii]